MSAHSSKCSNTAHIAVPIACVDRILPSLPRSTCLRPGDRLIILEKQLFTHIFPSYNPNTHTSSEFSLKATTFSTVLSSCTANTTVICALASTFHTCTNLSRVPITIRISSSLNGSPAIHIISCPFPSLRASNS
jgi:hypothetical protein